MTESRTTKSRKKKTTQELLNDIAVEKAKLAEKEKELKTRRKQEIKEMEAKKTKSFYDVFEKNFPDLKKMDLDEVTLFADQICDLDKTKLIQIISDILQ